MRICLYTETALPKMGGQEVVVDALARQYQRLGHDVVVLAPQPKLPLRAQDESLPYTVVRHPRFLSTRFFVAWYGWFLNRLHRQHRTEILHCHGVYPPGYIAGLSRGWRAIPTVITSHGGDIQPNNVRLLKPCQCRRIIAGLAAADRLIAISRFTEDRMRALCPQARISAIPNGVDLRPYSQPAPRPVGLANAIQPKGYFLFLGRLKQRKGVDLLLHALALLPPDSVAPLVITGAGEERAALEQLSTRLGLTQRVYFVGAMHGSAKAYLFANALATVVPSRISEAFGLVALESFAAGTPVIGTRLPGLEDLIEPGQTGWLVTPDAPTELARAMQEAWQNVGAARRLGEQGRRFAQSYDWSVVAQRHIELYQELLARQTTRAA